MNNAERTRRGFAPRTSERGTVLLMVIGVLAMISILAIVYASVGRTDRRTSAVFTREARIDQQIEIFADYVSTIISDDVFSIEQVRFDGETITTREAFDYPSVQSQRFRDDGINAPSNVPILSMINTPATQEKFNPVGDGSDPYLAPILPTNLGLGRSGIGNNSRNAYKLMRDWATITNIAPNGMFVNLYNLIGNFDAEPGIGTDSQGRQRMSERMFLFDDLGNFGSTTLAGSGQSLDPRIPAHLTQNQIYMFGPDGDVEHPLNSFLYTPHHFADVDGDGNRDARWFEMVDSSALGEGITSLIPDAEGMRLFWASRIVDLSGMVNVNTATDFVSAPRQGEPAGMSPADVDLRRLLGMTDMYATMDGAYNLLERPFDPGPWDYNSYSGASYNQTNAPLIGYAGYHALRVTHQFGLVPPRPLAGQPSAFTDARMNPDARFAFYDNFGFDPRGGRREIALDRTRMRFGAPFNEADELELRTYFQANDPDRTSRLESAVDGWYKPGGNSPFRAFGPLRSNRPLIVERSVDNQAGIGDGYTDEENMTQTFSSVRPLITTMSASRPVRATQLTDPDDLDRLAPEELRVDVFSLIDELDVIRELDDELAGQPVVNTTRFQKRSEEIVNTIFEAYVDALAPMLEERTWDPTRDDYRTLHYGHNPELAVRTAAHMTANLIDMYDEDHEPTKLSLILDRDWIGASNTYFEPVLRLPDRKLTRNQAWLGANAANAPSQHVNIFGIEPSPVLVSAASFVVYADAPPQAGGDDEFDLNKPGPFATQVDCDGYDINSDGVADVPLGMVTVNGDIRRDNPDFVMEVLAFQLHNPFGVRIKLTTRNDESGFFEPHYYIEYGGREFLLARQNVGVTGPQVAPIEIIMEPGETRVFYTTSPRDPMEVQARWNDLVSATNGLVVPGNVLNDWVEAQLQNSSDPSFAAPVPIPLVNPTNFQITGAFTTFDGSRGLVDLHGESLSQSTEENRDNRKVVNLWRVTRDEVGNDVAPGGMNNTANDQLVDRMRDPSAEPRLFKRIPAGENMQNNTRAGNEQSSNRSEHCENTIRTIVMWGAVERPTRPVGIQEYPEGVMPPWATECRSDNEYMPVPPSFSMNRAQGALGSTPDADSVFVAMTQYLNQYVRGTPPRVTFDSIRKSAGRRTGGSSTLANNSMVQFNDNLVKVQFSRTDDSMFKRPADFLLPLAIGPSADPGLTPAGARTRQSTLELQYVTFTEALAGALDYYSPDNINATYRRVGRDNRNVTPRDMWTDDDFPRFERGHLVLDAFVSFQDINFDGLIDTDTEPSFGGGVPLATRVLDVFRAWDYGTLTRGAAGLVNINTAPTNVLRAVPMLSPINVVNDWWWNGSSQHDNKSDIAATVAAYRDKIAVFPRGDTAFALDFRNNNDDADNPMATNDDNGRKYATTVPNIREKPGFVSLGELATIRDVQFQQDLRHDMDRLYYDGDDADHLGVVSTTVANATTDIADDYEERLAIVNAALNSTTVRSDTFCVWFLVHGYRRTDVEELGPTDALVPTIARRYMMLVDRSNVVRKGDKPRVILFREVPL